MSTFNMGDMKGIASVEMLLTILYTAEDLAAEALLNFQRDEISPGEYEAKKEEQQAYISMVGEVCRCITRKVEAQEWLKRYCDKNGIRDKHLRKMASDLAKGNEAGDLGSPNPNQAAFWCLENTGLIICILATERSGDRSFSPPEEFWKHLETATGISIPLNQKFGKKLSEL